MRFHNSNKERKAIRWALRQADPWGVDGKNSRLRLDLRSKEIKRFKERVKKFHLLCQRNSCCYCKCDLTRRTIEVDREHIIPKGSVRSHTFNAYNLSVACKTCNMTIKGERKDHIRNWRRNKRIQHLNILDERNYNIVHPNIHRWSDHIELYSEQCGEAVIRIYYPLDSRGRFTYFFFRLKEREVYMNKIAQSGKKINRIGIHPDILKAARENRQ